MWFHYTLTVKAGTLESAPGEKELNLTYGVIKWIAIPWDAATNRMVFVRIYRFEHQIFPINLDEAACGADFVEGGEEHYQMFEPPHVLLARGYAPETRHDHKVTILINVLPEIVAEPWKAAFLPLTRKIEWPIII